MSDHEPTLGKEHDEPQQPEVEKLKESLEQAARMRALYQHSLQSLKQSEASLRAEKAFSDLLINTAQVVILLLDEAGRIVFFNPFMERLGGYRLAEVKGKEWFATFIPERDKANITELFDTAALGEQTVGNINAIRTRSGEERSIQWYDKILSEPGSESKYLLCVGMDVTDLEVGRRALERSEARFRYFFEHNSSVMLLIDPESSAIIEANDAAVAYYGYPGKRLLEMRIVDINVLSPDRISEEMQRALSEKRNHFIFQHRLCSGVVRDVEVYSTPLEVSGRKLLLSIIHDISERKQAEAKLVENEHRYRSLFQSVSDYSIVLEYSEGGLPMIVDANDAALEKHGYRREEMIGQPISLIDRKLTSENMIEANRRIMQGEIAHFESEHLRKDGSTFMVEVSARRVEGDNPRLFYTVERDITERKRIELQLRLTQFTVDHSAIGVVWVNGDGRYDYVNDEACRMLGYTREEFADLHVGDINPGLDGEAWKAHFADTKEKRFLSFEIMSRRKDGTELPLQVIVNHVDFGGREFHCTFLVDRSEQKRSAETLRKSLEETILAISRAVEARDPYTAGHQQRVAGLSEAIARKMGVDEERIRGIRMGAMIHDIGKIQTPAEILSKPGKLSDVELLIIKEHPRIGYEILKDIHFPWPVAEIALQHHERMDGSGYPQGLKGDDICLEARIVAVADVVEAMGSHRPYRPGLGAERALEEVAAKKGTLYASAVVDACLNLFAEGYTFDQI